MHRDTLHTLETPAAHPPFRRREGDALAMRRRVGSWEAPLVQPRWAPGQAHWTLLGVLGTATTVVVAVTAAAFASGTTGTARTVGEATAQVAPPSAVQTGLTSLGQPSSSTRSAAGAASTAVAVTSPASPPKTPAASTTPAAAPAPAPQPSTSGTGSSTVGVSAGQWPAAPTTDGTAYVIPPCSQAPGNTLPLCPVPGVPGMYGTPGYIYDPRSGEVYPPAQGSRSVRAFDCLAETRVPWC